MVVASEVGFWGFGQQVEGRLHTGDCFFEPGECRLHSFEASLATRGIEFGRETDRGLGPDDNDLFALANRSGSVCAGPNYSYHRNVGRSVDAVKGKRRCRVAGDDEKLGSMGFEITGSFDGIARHGFD